MNWKKLRILEMKEKSKDKKYDFFPSFFRSGDVFFSLSIRFLSSLSIKEAGNL